MNNDVYTCNNGMFNVHTRLRAVYSSIFQPTCTSCTNMCGGEYIKGGEYSSREHCVYW